MFESSEWQDSDEASSLFGLATELRLPKNPAKTDTLNPSTPDTFLDDHNRHRLLAETEEVQDEDKEDPEPPTHTEEGEWTPTASVNPSVVRINRTCARSKQPTTASPYLLLHSIAFEKSSTVSAQREVFCVPGRQESKRHFRQTKQKELCILGGALKL